MPTPLRSGRGPVTARSTRFLSALKQMRVARQRAPASAQGERRPLSVRSGSGIHFHHAAWPQHRALTAAVDSLQPVREIAADPPQAPHGCEAVFSMCRQAVGVPTAALPLSCTPPFSPYSPSSTRKRSHQALTLTTEEKARAERAAPAEITVRPSPPRGAVRLPAPTALRARP